MRLSLRTLVASIAIAAACQTTRPMSQSPVTAESATDAAARVVAHVDSLTISRIDLGERRPGSNTFRAQIVNRASSIRMLGVDLRVTPGLWVLGATQRQKVVVLAPGESRALEMPYVVRRLTPEGRLRVRFGPGDSTHDSGMTQVSFERWFDIGAGNPYATDPRQDMVQRHSSAFEVYAHRASPASRELDAIVASRERAVADLTTLLDVPFTGRIRLVFYPDSATKVNAMGHYGMGFASGRTIVEIYSDEARLDPYHEIAHIVAGQVGSPPAALNEGFATYVTERLGGDALEHLGHAGRRIDDVVCAMHREGRLVPMDSLLGFEDIGTAESRPSVSYAQSASMVKYMVETLGAARFRQAYRELRSPVNAHVAAENARAFERIFGMTPAGFEASWLGTECAGGDFGEVHGWGGT